MTERFPTKQELEDVGYPDSVKMVRTILAFRAELEAAKCTLDDEIASHQDTLRLWNALRAERAKLEAALRKIETWPDHTRDDLADTVQRMQQIARVAQPAEGGATECKWPECECDQGHGGRMTTCSAGAKP